MKRIFTAFFIAVSALSFSSCTKTIIEDSVIMNTVVINVDQKNWAYSNLDNNNYFYANVSVPEINRQAFTHGVIKMYRTYDFGTGNATQIEMPYVRHKEYQYKGGDWGFYTESVDYEFSVGGMTIFYTASDFDYELDETFVPEAMQFRCVIMYE